MLPYVAALSLVGLVLMGLDKRLARLRRQRIPEAVLLGCAALGGSPGVWAGMYLFRHKTRKPRFFLGVPAMLLGQATLLLLRQRGII